MYKITSARPKPDIAYVVRLSEVLAPQGPTLFPQCFTLTSFNLLSG